MFLNIAENIMRKNKNDKLNNENTSNQNRLLHVQNIIIYVIAFLVSMMNIKGMITPFALSIFVASCNSNVPAGIVLIVTIIGSLIGFGIDSTFTYILNVLVFMISILIFKPVIQDNRNEMTRLGKNLILSTIIVQVANCIMKKELFVYDILISISSVILTYVFYKIFVNSISVIKDFNENRAFSIEEVIGATILVTIASVTLNQFNFAGIVFSNIVAIFMILALSLRSGILVGGTTASAIGLILGILGICTPAQVLTFVIAGFLAGVLSRFGKIATILGFLAGCAITSYIWTGFSVNLIGIKEIIISSFFFLFIPKFVGIDIRDIVEDVKLLEWNSGTRLADSNDTKDKLNNVSKVITEMANALGIEDKSLLEAEIDNINNSKVMFVEDLLNNLDAFPNNILYDDLTKLENGLIEDIYYAVVEKTELTSDDLIDIFEKRKNYIVGTEENEVIKQDIDQIVRIINRTYRINEMGFNWKTKFEDSRKTISKQLNGVSKAINEIADEITKEKNEKSKFKDKELQIRELLLQKNIEIKDIKIKKSNPGKLFVDIYFENTSLVKEKDKIKCIENIISKVCDEKVSIQKDTSNIDASSYMQRYTSEDRFTIQLRIFEIIKNRKYYFRR